MSARRTVAAYEAAAVAEAVAAARRSVALEGGVYRIRKELYGPPARRSLRRTAEAAITDAKLQRLAAAGRRQQWRIPVAAQGLRYDELLARYPDSPATAAGARALDDLRRALGAGGAAQLRWQDAACRMTLAVGSLAPLAGGFVVAPGSALYDHCLAPRRYLVVDAEASGRAWRQYAAGLEAALAGGGGRLALLPAVIDAAPAYLLFADAAPPGARSPADGWDLTTLITRLNLHP